MNIERKWHGYWINAGRTMISPTDTVLPAPYLRKTFVCDQDPEKAVIYLCGLGWHELYVNGQKADDRVLAPAISQFDKHVNYIEYDVKNLLKKGKNAIAVLLGNGLFNSRVPQWSFDKAPWRDFPKLLCDVEVDNRIVAQSDASWKVHESPIIFNEFRNGQIYDARREVIGFADPELDDSNWNNAALCMPPGGRVVLETQEPCKVMQSYPAVNKRYVTCWESTYDFGVNLSGWCKIKVKGPAGASMKLTYAEKVDPISGLINTAEIGPYENFGAFQTDEYILKGDPDGEVYESTFAYHGFRYAQFWSAGDVEVLDICAQFVHTAFAENGRFESSHELLDTLQRNTLQSYKSNFVGIPTDCPHREKNGWTGDAAIAAEAGLWNFDMEKSYSQFLRVLADTQRPNGQLPGIAPTGGWGFNWGSGPAWDNLLFEYPYQVYRFCGKTELIEMYYDNFKLYLEYCESRSQDNLLNFGLGDWCHWNRLAITPVEVTSSGYYYQNVLRTAFFAELLGKSADAEAYRLWAENIRKSFVQKFANADGTFADRALTATAAAIYFGLVEGAEAAKSAAALAGQVRQEHYHANFGIIGAKFTPRVLAEYGYIDDAFKLITQKEFPGWGWQVEQGATTLWETWIGKDSQNHIMFGDISAWMYQYLAGIQPCIEAPGFKKFVLKPGFAAGLDHVKASYNSPYGVIKSQWQRQDNQIKCEFEIPQNSTADIVLPGKTLNDVSGRIEAIVG
ncbi:MAG: hypothetical protein E7052_00105 [Lentisphaerae bacterium]|nr:hypothetical protein [Lentisphaerota bacterium]